MSLCLLPSCGDGTWYLVHCQARKELYTANILRSLLGLSIYLPEHKTHSRGKTRCVPFFPGYIFAQADLQKVSPGQINTSPGVVRLVDFGGEPQPVPLSVIKQIAERLKCLNTVTTPSFLPGDSVRVKQNGPLQNLEMIFLGPITPSRRVSVLLSFLGRMKETQVDVDILEVVPSGTHTAINLYEKREKSVLAK